MKYMGSKRAMLRNGLGEALRQHASDATRIVDLFSGSGSVAWFAAEMTPLPVLAVDLQGFCSVLARAVIERPVALEPRVLGNRWIAAAWECCRSSPLWELSNEADGCSELPERVHRSRQLCSAVQGYGPVWGAYGGHYFSPGQSLKFDCLLGSLPSSEPERTVCLAAALIAASRCAAAPGHTAQPFQPTTTAGRYIEEAWERDPLAQCARALDELCPRHAQVAGRALTADALDVANELGPNDLAVVDPPYSDVQYSRFYHVLETIARGRCGEVSGVGRYPPRQERPQSDFSRRGGAREALSALLADLAGAGCKVILTFPAGECSNGLSGEQVTELAALCFRVQERRVWSRFSTLGGNNDLRDARKDTQELLLVMSPR